MHLFKILVLCQGCNESSRQKVLLFPLQHLLEPWLMLSKVFLEGLDLAEWNLRDRILDVGLGRLEELGLELIRVEGFGWLFAHRYHAHRSF